MFRTIFPQARKDELLIEDAANELVVYDTQTDKAYVLNPAAAAVWRACNGKRSIQELTRYLNQRTPTTEQAVWYALGQLNELLEQPVTPPREFTKMTRRDFLKRASVAAGAAAIPVVVKIVAPTPAHAQSATVCCMCNDQPGFGISMGDCALCTQYCDAGHSGTDTCSGGNCPA